MKSSISKEEVDKILNSTDWQKYWSEVNENRSDEIEAYEKAIAMSRKSENKVILHD